MSTNARSRPVRRKKTSLLSKIKVGLFATKLYDLALGQRGPDHLKLIPANNQWVGDPDLGNSLIDGKLLFAGNAYSLDQHRWTAEFGKLAARDFLESFIWLRDLQAIGSEQALVTARDLLDDWILTHHRWDAFSWRPDLVGQRLSSWITNFPFFCPEPTSEFRTRFLVSASRQQKHLGRTITASDDDWRRFLTIKGFLYGGVALPGHERCIEQGLGFLEAEITRQILPDGGHCSRNPSIHLEVLRSLVDIRDLLSTAQIEQPASLQGAIDRMTPLLRSFRHGDGGLALFNGACEETPGQVDLVLRATGVKARALSSAPHSGFQRISAGKTLIVMDTGSAEQSLDAAHLGLLSFEMSHGQDRIIVNCGARPDDDTDWHDALKATAAHSTVILNDTSAIALKGQKRAPLDVTCQRLEENGSTLITARHDGYQDTFGCAITRMIYVADDGESIKGEDGTRGTPGQAIAVRFHLHPGVRVTMTEDGESALIKTARNHGWQFRFSGAKLTLEDSVYAGMNARLQRCQQLVLRAVSEDPTTIVKWALHKVS